MFFAITLLAMQALPDVLTRYREMGVLKRLRTTPVSPALLLFAQLDADPVGRRSSAWC